MYYETQLETVCCCFWSRAECWRHQLRKEMCPREVKVKQDLLPSSVDACISSQFHTHLLCAFIGKGPQHPKICGMKGPRVCLVTSLLVTEIYQPPAFLRMLGGEQRSCEKHWAILNPFRRYNKKGDFVNGSTSFLPCEIMICTLNK